MLLTINNCNAIAKLFSTFESNLAEGRSEALAIEGVFCFDSTGIAAAKLAIAVNGDGKEPGSVELGFGWLG